MSNHGVIFYGIDIVPECNHRAQRVVGFDQACPFSSLCRVVVRTHFSALKNFIQ
jgi:hypothetical protein